MKTTKTSGKSYFYKATVICLIITVSIVLMLLFTKCENPQVGGYKECCWICRIQTTYYNPQPGISELKITVKFADSVYCDCPDKFITDWEKKYSYADTIINGMKQKQVAVCKK